MLKGYKTIIFNVLATVVPILEITEFTAVISPEYLPFYMLSIALGNMYLRSVTTTPLGKPL